MMIPKTIEALINKRAILAEKLNSADYLLGQWLEKNGIEVEPCDIYGGCELYGNPWDSAERIKEAIENKTR